LLPGIRRIVLSAINISDFLTNNFILSFGYDWHVYCSL